MLTKAEALEALFLGLDDAFSDYIPSSPPKPPTPALRQPLSHKSIQSSPLKPKNVNSLKKQNHIKIELEEKENWQVTKSSQVDGTIIKKKKVEIIIPKVPVKVEVEENYDDWGSDIVMTQEDELEEKVVS